MKGAISGLQLLIILFCAHSFVSCAHGPAPAKIGNPKGTNTVSFKSSEDGINGGALNLTGRLTKPEGDGHFPAIVLLHGCGGILPKRDHRWAERLSGWGYVTLQVDSFRPRGLSSVCTYSGSDSVDIVRKRVEDAYDARRYIAGLPFVDRNRVAVMGWSHGGMTTLHALYRETDNPFRAAVAFYPPCRRTLAGLNAPLLILIGEADDWSLAGRCVSAMPKEKTALDVILKVYPGAYHDFDRVGVSTDVRGATGMHHLQYQQEAEADSIIQVKAFFGKHLRGEKNS